MGLCARSKKQELQRSDIRPQSDSQVILAELLSSILEAVPTCTAAWNYSDRCMTLNLFFLNLMHLLSSQSSSMLRSIYMVGVFSSLVSSAVLARMHLNFFIRIVCKTLDSVEPSIDF